MAYHLTYSDAARKLPADAKWSCSFGNPGCGGYVEYHRTAAGERWKISNGPYDMPACLFEWRCERNVA